MTDRAVGTAGTAMGWWSNGVLSRNCRRSSPHVCMANVTAPKALRCCLSLSLFSLLRRSSTRHADTRTHAVGRDGWWTIRPKSTEAVKKCALVRGGSSQIRVCVRSRAGEKEAVRRGQVERHRSMYRSDADGGGGGERVSVILVALSSIMQPLTERDASASPAVSKVTRLDLFAKRVKHAYALADSNEHGSMRTHPSARNGARKLWMSRIALLMLGASQCAPFQQRC